MASFDSKFGPAAARVRHRADPLGASGAGDRNDGRRAGRLRCAMMGASLGTTHGELLDASATGARVLVRRNPELSAGAEFTMEIDPGAGMGGTIRIACRVVWVRLNADKKFELGVEFVNMPEPVRKRLLEAVLNPTRTESLRRGWSVVGGLGVDDGEEDAVDGAGGGV
ncbi:MAG: PilZ domain-containing protein [Phycisphaeraceae bacterium]|nr:PilZ domain-containing protein [Phycisphaeraceae bacterium]